MFVLKMKSIAGKLILITGVAIALVLLVSNVLLIGQTSERVSTLTMGQADREARSIANQVSATVGELAGAARSMAGVIGRGHENKFLDRKTIIDLLKVNAEKNPLAFGSWFAEEPNAFDGKAADFAGKTEFGGFKDGTFNPYWTKRKDGSIAFSVFPPDYKADWYSLAAKSKKGAMSTPYAETGTGEGVTMTSIAYPVFSGEKMIGVAGVDISLSTLSKQLQAMHPFGTGRVLLLAQGGKWVVAPKPDLSMKLYEGEGSDVITKAFSSLEPAVINDLSFEGEENFDRVVLPFQLPDVNATWIILVDVPHSTINAAVQSQTVMMIVGGLLVLAAVMLALYLAVRSLVQRPLGGLVASVSRLGAGHYDQAVGGQDRTDEVGSVAKALESLRHTLADGRRLEQDAAGQRMAAEQERTRNDQERTESANLQLHVVQSLGKALAELSRGNLAYRIEDNFPGNYAGLKQDFNKALQSLDETIVALHATVHTINSGTGEISRSTTDLAHRTEQQAASLEETAASLNELTDQVNTSAENARIAAETVNVTCTEAERSGEIVRKAIESMRGIEASSQQVSTIIGVIDEIAFQTNLLALNAGVEAARAGEAGKGFAVVAQEVRELAQRSANAAKEIKSLINASGLQVKDGVELVGEAGSALGRIAEKVMDINELIRQISSSASDQAVGLKEINAAVNQMDKVTQQNAAMVEETTATSMVLNDEANSLKQMVVRFNVSGTASAQRTAPAPAARQAAQSAPRPRAAAPVPQSRGATALATEVAWEDF